MDTVRSEEVRRLQGEIDRPEERVGGRGVRCDEGEGGGLGIRT